jgi:hypothetical protein
LIKKRKEKIKNNCGGTMRTSMYFSAVTLFHVQCELTAITNYKQSEIVKFSALDIYSSASITKQYSPHRHAFSGSSSSWDLHREAVEGSERFPDTGVDL